jgi:hypothetical protein
MFLKLLGRRREPILAATGATETLRYATIGDRSSVACNLDQARENLQNKLKTSICNTFGQNKKIICYHSESKNKINRETMSSFKKDWVECDVLIYSLTITAGVLFELPHFHELYSFIDNNFGCPTVDSVLQQMFRVRQLIDGNMYLFINDPNYTGDNNDNNCYLPLTPDGIDKHLDHDINNINKYYGEHCINIPSSL